MTTISYIDYLAQIVPVPNPEGNGSWLKASVTKSGSEQGEKRTLPWSKQETSIKIRMLSQRASDWSSIIYWIDVTFLFPPGLPYG